MYLKLKDKQFSSVPLFILCDRLKNDTILLGGDICKGWHSRYWGEYKGHNDVQHNELSMQNMIEIHKKFPQTSSMMVFIIFNKLKFIFTINVLFLNCTHYLR